MRSFIAVLALTSACLAPPPSLPASPPGGDWAPCEVDAQCESRTCYRGSCAPDECGAGCDPGLVCGDHGFFTRCEPPGQRGERCLSRDDTGGRYDRECIAGLLCAVAHHAFGAEGLCVPETGRLAQEPCKTDGDCASPLACTALERCAAPAGEACFQDADCLSRDCAPTGVCLDEPCGRVFELCLEPEGTICTGGPCGRACTVPAEEGQPCFVDDPVCPEYGFCANGLTCGEDGTCTP